MLKGTYEQLNGSEEAERHVQRRNFNGHWLTHVQTYLQIGQRGDIYRNASLS